MQINVVTPQELFNEIAKIASEMQMSWIDSIVYYCEKADFDIETAAAMISKNMNMVANIQAEGEELRLLPRTARLPI